MTIDPKLIRLARVSREHTGAEVAEALGIRQPTYSKIENGLVEPSAQHLESLSAFLRYPPGFFEQTDRIWGTASPHHRKRKVSTLRLDRLEAQLNVTRLQVRRLVENVDIDTTFAVPTIHLDDVPTASDAAQEVRRLWRLPTGPVSNVTAVLEDAGVIVVERPLPEQFDAVSVWGPTESPVILLNANYATARKRQTLAHELGHLVMHIGDLTEDPETEANDFAREFLMPAAEIRNELVGLRISHLADLKLRWRTSMRNIVYHARELGSISKDQARYLFMRMNKEFGSKTEPLELPSEPPTLLREFIDVYRDTLNYEFDEIAAVMHADLDDFMNQYGPPDRHLRAL